MKHLAAGPVACMYEARLGWPLLYFKEYALHMNVMHVKVAATLPLPYLLAVKLWSLDGFALDRTLVGHGRWVWDCVFR